MEHQDITEKIETQEMFLEEKHKTLTEYEAEELAEENFLFCDFEDNEPVLVKTEDLEMFKAYSYSQLFKGLTEIGQKSKNQTATLYLVDDELEEEEAFLKVKLCQHTDTEKTEQTTQATTPQPMTK